MNVSTQLLDYKALAICTYNPTIKCDNYLWHLTYWCCYYVTMAMNVLYNNCNVCIHDLPDMNALISLACSSGDLVYISGKSSCTCYNYYVWCVNVLSCAGICLSTLYSLLPWTLLYEYTYHILK